MKIDRKFIFLKASLMVIASLSFNCSLFIDKPRSAFEEEEGKRRDNAYMIDIPLKGSLQNPAWSPDGKSLLFTRFRSGYNEDPADIYTYNLETKELKCLVADNSGNINLPGSAWKSNKIIFSSSRDPHDEIFTISDNGNPGEEIKLTQRSNHVAYEPSFSMVENFIVFESHVLDVEENGKIVIKDLSASITTGYTELTNSGDCRQPNWSPDGQLILYQSLINDKWDIWIMNKDGSNKKQVTKIDGENTDASFSPDSQRIIYSGVGGHYANLFIISIAGGAPTRLTTFNGGYDGAPSWSINNKIAFESCAGDPDETLGTKIWIIDIP